MRTKAADPGPSLAAIRHSSEYFRGHTWGTDSWQCGCIKYELPGRRVAVAQIGGIPLD